jgi:hypothetical protein
MPSLTISELDFIRTVWNQPGPAGGVSDHGLMEFPESEGNEAAWMRLSLRIRKAGADALICDWKRLLAREAYRGWFDGYSLKAIGDLLKIDPANVTRNLDGSFTIENLLVALYLKGPHDWVFPRRSEGYTRSLVQAAGIRRTLEYFGQAEVLGDPNPGPREPWEMELFLTVFRSAREWVAALTRAQRTPEAVGAIAPLVKSTLSQVVASLRSNNHDADQIEKAVQLTADVPAAWRQCMRWHEAEDVRVAYAWTVTAFERHEFEPAE